jgi:hypothetical protein
MGGGLRVYGFMGSRVEDLVCLVGLEVIERSDASSEESRCREHREFMVERAKAKVKRAKF